MRQSGAAETADQYSGAISDTLYRRRKVGYPLSIIAYRSTRSRLSADTVYFFLRLRSENLVGLSAENLIAIGDPGSNISARRRVFVFGRIVRADATCKRAHWCIWIGIDKIGD